MKLSACVLSPIYGVLDGTARRKIPNIITSATLLLLSYGAMTPL